MRALVLEPDRTVRAWLEAGLRSRGHAVVSRSAAEEAWAAYDRQRPRLALLDFAGTDGAELCRRIRAGAEGECCVVLATGLSDRPGDVKGALDAGADDFLPKMADAGVIEARLAVAERRARQAEKRTAAERSLRDWERRYWSLVERTRDVVADVSPEERLVSLNPAFETLTGWPPDEWTGRALEDLLHPEDVRVVRAAVRRALGGAEPRPAEIRLRSRQGGWRIVEWTVAPRAQDASAGVLAVVRDVTRTRREQTSEAARRVAARALRDAQSLAEGAGGLLRALCIGLGWEVGLLWTADPDGQRLSLASLWHLPGVDVTDLRAAARAARPRRGEGPPGEVWQRGSAAWTADGAGHGLRAGMTVPMRCGPDVAGVVQLLSPEARPLDPFALRSAEEMGAEIGAILGRRQAEEAEANARRARDPQTSLPDRTRFMERLGRALARSAGEPAAPLAVLLIDLGRAPRRAGDDLDPAADRALVSHARRLEAGLRRGDCVCRFGTEEFAVLLQPVARAADAIGVADRLRAELSARGGQDAAEPLAPPSIGVALSAGGDARPEELLREAQAARDRARAAGRARRWAFEQDLRDHEAATPAKVVAERSA